ncbi:MAG: hypothetical protein EXR12_00755 [Rhodospirillaceae bacterium]|nr:hypothetical protein [Rhodospirillaceae bacterium]
MPTDAVALYAAVILLLPMAAFFLASPTFLLVGLEVPEVTQLLRGIFNGYFLAIGIAGIVAMVLFTVSGRPVFSASAISITAFALTARHWLLQHIDAELQARDAGASGAIRQLRILHVKGMLINAAQLAIVVACVPLIA